MTRLADVTLAQVWAVVWFVVKVALLGVGTGALLLRLFGAHCS